MVAKNDITGDLIATRINSKNYTSNYDNIFQPKQRPKVELSDGSFMIKCSERCWLEVLEDKFKCGKPHCPEGI